jgi:hypothetical protein
MAKRRIAVRKKSSKRSKTTAKPTPKKAKRTTAKNAMSKVRRVDTRAASDAPAKLETLSLAKRIAAVAADVASKRDEYREIDPHELALLLDIGDAYRPGGDWESVWFVPCVTVNDILLQWGDGEFITDLLQPHVTSERYEELNLKIGLINETKERYAQDYAQEVLEFLTQIEKETIERVYMEREADDISGPSVVAFYTIKAPRGKKLTFCTYIGDNGEGDDLMTPYDERDGAFPDLSDCLIVEDHRG